MALSMSAVEQLVRNTAVVKTDFIIHAYDKLGHTLPVQ